MNRLTVASEAMEPKNSGDARNWLLSVACSPPATEPALRGFFLVGAAVTGESWLNRSSQRLRKSKAFRKLVSADRPAWETRGWFATFATVRAFKACVGAVSPSGYLFWEVSVHAFGT